MQRINDSFSFGNAVVRTTTDEQGQLWFVAKDVAEALEYTETSVAHIKNLTHGIPEEWKGRKIIMTLGGQQELSCLSEPGLYWFLGKSEKPKALPFQKWVFGDVLPSIRQTGGCSLPLRMEEVKQIARLAEPYKRDAFRRLLAQAGKQGDKAQGTRCMLNICCIFAAAETGAPLEQARLNI